MSGYEVRCTDCQGSPVYDRHTRARNADIRTKSDDPCMRLMPLHVLTGSVTAEGAGPSSGARVRPTPYAGVGLRAI